MSTARNYLKVCLTGGPCSGKTSALTAIKQQFSNKFIIYEVPEVGTLAFNAGVNLLPSAYSKEEHKVFTHGICKAQIDLESYFETLAGLQKKPVLIVCDRGVSDNFAYTHPDNKQLILAENNWSMDFVRDDRYDLVLYLVTAASGAVEFYTNANNEARSESPEEAVRLDDLNAAQYVGHPNLRMIDNTHSGFGEKISRVLSAIGSFVNRAPEVFHAKAYLLPATFRFDSVHHSVEHHHFRGVFTRIAPIDDRKAVFWVARRFNHFNKPPVHELVVQKIKQETADSFTETHQLLTAEEYERLVATADPAFPPLEKSGVSFLYKIGSEHDVVSLGGFKTKNGDERFVLRLIRDTRFVVETRLPEWAEGAERVSRDLFSFLKESAL